MKRRYDQILVVYLCNVRKASPGNLSGHLRNAWRLGYFSVNGIRTEDTNPCCMCSSPESEPWMLQDRLHVGVVARPPLSSVDVICGRNGWTSRTDFCSFPGFLACSNKTQKNEMSRETIGLLWTIKFSSLLLCVENFSCSAASLNAEQSLDLSQLLEDTGTWPLGGFRPAIRCECYVSLAISKICLGACLQSVMMERLLN